MDEGSSVSVLVHMCLCGCVCVIVVHCVCVVVVHCVCVLWRWSHKCVCSTFRCTVYPELKIRCDFYHTHQNMLVCEKKGVELLLLLCYSASNTHTHTRKHT